MFFEVPVSYLVTNNFIEPSSEYQLRNNSATDIPRRELAASAGVRYLRKPDENEGRSHGAIGPRAFVMPLMDVDQVNLGPRFSREDPFQAPHLDSNQDKGVPKTRVLPTHHGNGDKTRGFPPSVYYAICGHHLIPRVGRFRR